MNTSTEKPENFTVVIRGGIAHMDRNLEFGKDAIRLQLQLKPDDLGAATVVELHQLALKTAIGHLQGLLNDSLEKAPPKA